ncbi:MAG: ferritin family protein [Syntrophales bacterium LBB04]|nr:ferritin family protein [Syntrophales bacterium LBB04]
MSTSQDPVMQLLAIALTMEEKGQAFYDKAAANCQNELGRKIFARLAADELVHVERIQAIHKRLSRGLGFGDEWRTLTLKGDPGKVFRDMAANCDPHLSAAASDLEALDLGIDFEKQSIKFYQDALAQTSSEPEKNFLEALVREEKGHHASLSDMKTYLADPAAWFQEKERSGLDGA